MIEELQYPFDPKYIISKKKSIKKKLLSQNPNTIEKKIAILGGETTQNIKLILELFLLNYGISPIFYESEYNQWFEDGMFPNEELVSFEPDIIYIRNITEFPTISDDMEAVNGKRNQVYSKFEGVWENLRNTYQCPIIQNNFEYPFYRLMGNKDASDCHGRVNFVTMLNCMFYQYAQS